MFSTVLLLLVCLAALYPHCRAAIASSAGVAAARPALQRRARALRSAGATRGAKTPPRPSSQVEAMQPPITQPPSPDAVSLADTTAPAQRPNPHRQRTPGKPTFVGRARSLLAAAATWIFARVSGIGARTPLLCLLARLVRALVARPSGAQCLRLALSEGPRVGYPRPARAQQKKELRHLLPITAQSRSPQRVVRSRHARGQEGHRRSGPTDPRFTRSAGLQGRPDASETSPRYVPRSAQRRGMLRLPTDDPAGLSLVRDGLTAAASVPGPERSALSTREIVRRPPGAQGPSSIGRPKRWHQPQRLLRQASGRRRGQLSFNDSGEPRRRGGPHRGISEGESEGSVAGPARGEASGSRHRSRHDASPLLTAGEVASLLGVPRTWVYEQSRAGRIPTVTLGRYRRYRLEAIETWLRQLEARGS
jgi:excisionase family DNA binding protein